MKADLSARAVKADGATVELAERWIDPTAPGGRLVAGDTGYELLVTRGGAGTPHFATKLPLSMRPTAERQ